MNVFKSLSLRTVTLVDKRRVTGVYFDRLVCDELSVQFKSDFSL